VYLVAAESAYNFKVRLSETVHVNATSPAGLELEFDITFRNLACPRLNIDANDPNGQPQSLHLDRQHHVWKHKIKYDDGGKLNYIGDRSKLELGSTLQSEDILSKQLEGILNTTVQMQDENYCGSCYGAGEEGECCNACDDVKRAYNLKGWVLRDLENVEQCKGELVKVVDKDEGCNIHGKVALSSGGGNLHLAPGREGQFDGGDSGQVSLFDLIVRTFQEWNVSHTIHKIRFGAEVPEEGKNRYPLDGEERIIADSYGMYQYYFQVSEAYDAKRRSGMNPGS
jgi:endoplasmic reticulum-Golgi intermediate compartment protein 3